MSARNWNYAQEWSKAKLLGGHWSGPHQLPEMQNWAIGTTPLFIFSSVQTELGEVSRLCRDKQGFQAYLPACLYIWALVLI